ncbi:MAG: Ig-like domain-containing protein, partial [Planctomycetota bacterium]
LTNEAPVANDDFYEEAHNVELIVNETTGTIQGLIPAYADTDADNENEDRLFDDILTAEVLADPTYGSVVLEEDGSFTYTPSQDNDTGSDSFTYTVSDGFGGEDTATVTIDLTNEAPVANDDFYEEAHNVELIVDETTGTIQGLIPAYADTDADNSNEGKIFDDVLTAELVSGTTYGNLVLNEDGSFTYTPSQDNTTGSDSFTYTVSDGFGGEDTATVTIDLTNEAPVANDDFYEEAHNVELIVDETDGTIQGFLPAYADTDADNSNEGKIFDDVLTAELVSGTTYGDVVLNDDGSFTYTPDESLMLANTSLEDDSFTYLISDGFGGTDTATVTISLTNESPVAQPDSYQTPENETLVILPPLDVITGVTPANEDTDADNENSGKVFDDILTAELIDGPTIGIVVFNDDGSFTYTPFTDVSGEDTFTYRVTDGFEESNTVTVTIDVIGSPPPTPSAPAAPLPEIEYPEIQGCPVLMEAAASELGVTAENIQITIGRALAQNPNLQPCQACGNLLGAAVVLRDDEGAFVEAMGQALGDFVEGPAITEEQVAAFLQTVEDRRGNPEYLAYADAGNWNDAFASYIGVLVEFGLDAEQILEIVTKYMDTITEGEDEALAAYVEFRLAQLTAGL